MATSSVELTQEAVEKRSLAECESVIERGLKTYVEVGKALAAIADGKLYRWQGYQTFEDYCDKRWSMRRQTAYDYVKAAAVQENVRLSVQTAPSFTQAREMASLAPEQQRAIATRLDFSTATVNDVRQAVQEVRNPGVLNFHQPTPPVKASPIVACGAGHYFDGAASTECPYCYKAAQERYEFASRAKEQVPVVEDAPPASRMDVHYSSDSPEWYTPPEIIKHVLALLGTIDLDPCSNSGPTPNIPAASRFTQVDNGLVHEWNGRVYMNPPYGRPIVEWVDKLVAEHKALRVTEAIALVPARVDTDWFRKFRDYAVCFIDGRLKFSGHENSAPFPSAVIYLGGRLDEFYDAFNDLGDVWVRWQK